MKKVLLLSDTHGHVDDRMLAFASDRDELWHAGDWGAGVAEKLEALGLRIRGVYGNIDGQYIRTQYPLHQYFRCDGLAVFMTHIGGHPGRYAKGIGAHLQKIKPDLFISGHSHILKIVKDEKLGCLHMNPGAAGKSGFHIFRTMIRFSIEQGKIIQPEVIQLGRRSEIETELNQ